MTDYDKIEQIKNLVLEVLEKMKISAPKVEFEESINRGLVFNISTPDSFLLIGQHGVVLKALQSIIQSLAFKKLGFAQTPRFSLDVDDYNIKREWFLKETVKEAALHIKKTGRAVRLETMPAFDRRFVHSYIQENFPELSSESWGEEPYRQIVIKSRL